MHRNAIAQAVAASLGLLLVGAIPVSPLHAQTKAPAGDAASSKAEAERAGKEGERLLAQHDAAGAITELARAYSLSRNPKYLLPLGLAYAEAERPLDALEALGGYLKDAGAVSDADRRKIGTRFTGMMDQVGALLTLEASRNSAQVRVDGRPVGVTPLSLPLRLPPGKHEILMMPAPTDPSSGAKVLIEVKPGEHKTIKLEPGTRSRFLEPQSQNEGETDEPGRRAGLATTAAVATQPTKPPPSGGESVFHDLHKKWWFWTGVGGAVAVLGIGLGVGLGRRGSGASTEFPNVQTWPGGAVDARPSALVLAAGLAR
ncbi:MAG: hypothetical protein U1A78_04310 [Polyangia bacterium]